MKKSIPVSELFAKWRKDPEYVKEYEALEDEFSAAEALIKARKSIELAQDKAAKLTETPPSIITTIEH